MKSFLQFYKAYCKFHNFPNSLRLEEEIQSHPMAGRAVGDGVDHEQLKMSIIEKIKVFFQSIIAIHGGFFWDDQSIIDFIDEDLEREFSSESMLTLRVDAAHSEVRLFFLHIFLFFWFDILRRLFRSMLWKAM